MNKSLKAWVAFVKKVQKEEKLSYKDAIHRAKVRKDKGEKWMKGGAVPEERMEEEEVTITPDDETVSEEMEETIQAGGRKRRTMRRGRSARKSRAARRTRGRGRARASRRH